MWENIEQGATIGTIGSESGEIIVDVEHDLGARLTIEKGGSTAPFSITSGVYGCFVHTSFYSSIDEAKSDLETMKSEISEFFGSENTKEEDYEWINRFVDKH